MKRLLFKITGGLDINNEAEVINALNKAINNDKHFSYSVMSISKSRTDIFVLEYRLTDEQIDYPWLTCRSPEWLSENR